jgi:hypothetical protein
MDDEIDEPEEMQWYAEINAGIEAHRERDLWPDI